MKVKWKARWRLEERMVTGLWRILTLLIMLHGTDSDTNSMTVVNSRIDSMDGENCFKYEQKMVKTFYLLKCSPLGFFIFKLSVTIIFDGVSGNVKCTLE